MENALLQEELMKVGKPPRLKPMATAPRDGREILAYDKDGKNFHPICWKDGHWGMRWNQEYYTRDGFYSGWIPYPGFGI